MEDIKDGIVTKDSIVGITYSIEINGEVEDKFSDRHFNYDQRTGSTLPGLKDSLIGKKIGDEVDGNFLGLNGYKLKITGGTDKDGFPMIPSLNGTVRKKVLLSKPPGFHPTKKGERRRKTVRGNTISFDIDPLAVEYNYLNIKNNKEKRLLLISAQVSNKIE